MADSDKLALLAKRKLQLDHAIRNGMGAEHISKRVEKIRSAALAVLKKYRSPFANVTGAPGNEEWKIQEQNWVALTHAEILDICIAWPEKPNIQHVRIK